MSKRLHEMALVDAVQALIASEDSLSWADDCEAVISAYLRHLAAHGVKLTPGVPTEHMTDQGGSYQRLWDSAPEGIWQQMWNAAPDWPGDA